MQVHRALQLPCFSCMLHAMRPPGQAVVLNLQPLADSDSTDLHRCTWVAKLQHVISVGVAITCSA
jgi:hypothetical protein